MSRRHHCRHVMTVRCSYCSRQVAPSRATALASGQIMCERCFEWHMHAVEVLGGDMPRGCQECGITTVQLAERTPGDRVSLFVVPKDGIYQLLCANCLTPYTVKRADLYGETSYGRDELKLN